MKKEAMFQLASFGVKTKLAMMERELRELFRDFPDAFASATPPVLLRPERKTNGNDWPTIPTSADDTVVASDAAPAPRRKHPAKKWTPARLAKHKQFMKEKADAEPWGTFTWQRVHDFLAKQPKRTAKMADILTGAKVKTQPTVISAMKIHSALFAKVGTGMYKLKKTVEH